MRKSACDGRVLNLNSSFCNVTMTFPRCVLLGTLILLVALISVDNVSAARGRGGGHHSYPSSRGLSGHGSSGSHSYPSSNHGYPSSGGLSGNNGGSHGYPSSGGSHGYPSSGGSHAYPSSGGMSGNNHGYPGGKGMSGNTHTTHTTNVYNNYHYSPPQQIRYTPAHGPPVNYPVYHGTPPTYVYQYKDSGSKYGTLLTGLALLNLGTLAGTAYAVSHSGSGSSSGYKSQPGEVCKFGVKKENGDYEETRIDCQLITSFIFQAEREKSQNGGTNTSVVTTTVTNVTMVNNTNGVVEPAPVTPVVGNVTYTMLPNGTLIPTSPINVTSPEPAANGVSSSVSVMTTTTNTTVTNALDVKGKPIDVTPGMQCYVIRHSASSNLKKTVPCGLLQSYATQSLKKNSATRNIPVYTILTVISAVLLVY